MLAPLLLAVSLNSKPMPPSQDKEKILYLDDETLNCRVFERSLSRYFDVLVALNCDEAFGILNEHPEIIKVVTDYKMPDMNGLEFIHSVRENYGNKACYILSGFDRPPDVKDAMEKGTVEAYFRKPFNREQLLSHLQ